MRKLNWEIVHECDGQRMLLIQKAEDFSGSIFTAMAIFM